MIAARRQRPPFLPDSRWWNARTCAYAPSGLPELFVICNDSSLDAQYERPCADVDNAQFVKLMQICNEDRVLSL